MPGDCSICGHPFGPHVLVATEFQEVRGREIPIGGTVHCPRDDCDCTCPFSVNIPGVTT